MDIVGEPVLGLLTMKDRRNLVEQLTREFIMMGVERGEVFQMQAWLWEAIHLMCTIPAHSYFLGPTVSDILDNLLYATDCPEHAGIHVWQDAFVVETVNPKTMEPVGPGEKGRLVVSNIFAEGVPPIKIYCGD